MWCRVTHSRDDRQSGAKGVLGGVLWLMGGRRVQSGGGGQGGNNALEKAVAWGTPHSIPKSIKGHSSWALG